MEIKSLCYRVAAFCLLSILFSCATNTDTKAAMRMDPGIVGFALPGIIKSSESKLKKNPHNQKIILDAGSYNIMYANAFIQGPASILPPSQYQKRDKEYKRAKKYYARGVNILNAGIEDKYPGITTVDSTRLKNEYLQKLTKEDVPHIYWLTAGTLCAFSMDPFDLKYGAEIATLSMLIKRAYEIDADYDGSVLDEFFFLYYTLLPAELGGDKTKAPQYYERALKKTNGFSAGLYVSWAECISIPNQDYKDFKAHLDKALAINVEEHPDTKLTNILAQRKAKYYLENAQLYFIDTEE
ncbi:MAG: hypothetical protein Ta2B_05960 [Termitinemataceae bacterium]|nr:MAG: hypothetical protein Ta2B_05960 [Termitinemataceae bacterium]